MQIDDWQKIWSEFEQLVRTDTEIAPRAVENARAFLDFAQSRYIAPEEIGRGYRATISLSWIRPLPFEIEIRSDTYELYRFFEGRTEIHEFAHRPNVPIPEELVVLLREIASPR